MPKTVTASEAKTRLGSLMEWVTENRDEVVVKNRGEPRAVIISFEAYQEIERLRNIQRRQDALARVEKLREAVRTRNQDLAPDEALRLAGFSDRVIQEEITAESSAEAAG